MIKTLKERCIVCNGKGKRQVFDDNINRWAYIENSPICRDCNGTGEREYILTTNGTDFLKRKIYL